MMGLALDEDHRMIKEYVAELSRKEFAPRAAEIDKTASFPRENFRKLASLDLAGMNAPEEFGGPGTDTLSFVLTMEEIAKACGSTALVLLAHHFVIQGLTLAGTKEQKSRFLPLLAKGEALGAFAVHEPNSGCVHSAIETKASKENGRYLVNGSKFFITSAGEADLYLTLVVTDKSRGGEGLSLLLMEKQTAGMTFGKRYDRLGFRGTSGRDVYFGDCPVPLENLLGKEGEGLRILGAISGKFAMLGAAAMSLGIAEAALEASIGHVKRRTIAGKPLAAHQTIRFMIAEMGLLIDAAKSLVYSAAIGSGAPPMPSPPGMLKAKLFASEMAVEVTNKALQIHGGHGYCSDLPVERYFRDARGLTFHFSTTELLKENIAGAILEEAE